MSVQSFPTTTGTSNSGMTLLASGMAFGALNLTSIPSGYQNIMLRLTNVSAPTASEFGLILNGLSSTTAYNFGRYTLQTTPVLSGASGISSFTVFYAATIPAKNVTEFTVYNYSQPTSNKLVTWISTNDLGGSGFNGTGRYAPNSPAAITSISSASGNFTGGTYELFGIK